MSNKIPRRAIEEQHTAAEKAIYEAISKVEEMGADVRLTDSVMKLQEAFDSVADFTDGINRET